jgi:GLPGLI family protein
MLRQIRQPVGAVLAFLLLAAPAAAQGLYWESTVSGGPVPGAKASKSYAMPKKIRMEQESSTIIMRLDKEMFYMIQPAAKTYSEMSFADMEKMMKTASEAMAAQLEQVKKQLKDLPPEQRAAVEKQFADNPLFKAAAADPKVEVAKTTDKRDIAGYSCTKVVVKEDGKESMTAWVTSDIKGFAALREDFTKMMRRMAESSPMLGKGLGQAFEKIEGFPLETEMKGTKTTVTKIEARTTPDSEFEVPAGFTKTASPLEALSTGLKAKAKP